MKFIFRLRCTSSKLFKIYSYLKFSTVSPNFKIWNIVFFGSDDFSIVSLQELIYSRRRNLIQDVEVVSVNNICSLYKFAVSNNIKCHIWPPKFQKSFDFGVIVSFGKLIPKDIIECFPLGIINVHASLLPKWRGAMPIFHAIKNGDSTTGITIISIHPDKFDTGEIILQKSFTIGKNEMYTSLHNRLSKYSSKCLIEVIQNMPQCLEKKILQSNEGVSLAKKITKDISVVNWKELTALQVYNLYRAVYGTYTLKTYLRGNLVNLLCLSLNNCKNLFLIEKGLTQPGQIKYFLKEKLLVVKCKDGALNICTVMVKGKIYSAQIFLNFFLNQDQKNMKFDEKE